MAKCEQSCNNEARFQVHQATMPQTLGNGELESSPAGRSTVVCGNHLSYAVTMLGTLPFRTDESVTVAIQR